MPNSKSGNYVRDMMRNIFPTQSLGQALGLPTNGQARSASGSQFVRPLTPVLPDQGYWQPTAQAPSQPTRAPLQHPQSRVLRSTPIGTQFQRVEYSDGSVKFFHNGGIPAAPSEIQQAMAGEERSQTPPTTAASQFIGSVAHGSNARQFVPLSAKLTPEPGWPNYSRATFPDGSTAVITPSGRAISQSQWAQESGGPWSPPTQTSYNPYKALYTGDPYASDSPEGARVDVIILVA